MPRTKKAKNGTRMWYFAVAIAVALLFALAVAISGTRNQTSASGGAGYRVLQYDGGPSHTYMINSSTPKINISVGGAIYGTPTIYDGVIYVTTMGNLTELQNNRYDLTRGTVSAIALNTGAVLWRDTLPNQIMTQPITAGNLIIVGMSNNGEVPAQYYNNIGGMIGIDANTGRVIWNVSNGLNTPTGTDLTTPAYYKGLIIEPGMGTVIIYNASTGAIVNSIITGIPDILSSPLLEKGIAYFGAGYATAYGFNSFSMNLSGVPMNITSDERFFAVNVTAGRIVWQRRFVNAGTGLNDVCAAFANGTIVTAYLYQSDYTDPVIAALNSSTGDVLWRINETKYINTNKVINSSAAESYGLNYTQNSISPVTVWNGTAYIDSNFIGVLFAVNISRGNVLWATQTGQDESNPNIFYGHYLITVNDGGFLMIINSTNGQIVNESYIGMPHLAAEPIITQNYAILAGMNGKIISLPLKALIRPNING
ncbi:MAG: outer membrane protein assembly factor BamB family protein [Candidatus Micrarchaeaceae archaeon]